MVKRLIAAVVMALVPGVVGGQTLVGPVPNLRPGHDIWATMTTGEMIRGRVVRLSASGLELRGRDLPVPIDRIERIERRDSLRNGATIGALVGGVTVGTAVMLMVDPGCTAGLWGAPVCNDVNGPAAGGLLIGAGLGAVIGAAIDRLSPGREVLYHAAAKRKTVSFAPITSVHGAGARLSLRW